jgi:NitT/TauT family transport system substrate-binding protein
MRLIWAAVAAAIVFLPATGIAQAPKANGETLKIQNYAGTTGNMHAIVAKAKGLCEKYNFTCETVTINSTSLGFQALVGKTIDVVQGGGDIAASTLLAGGDVVIVGVSLPNTVLSISVRNDVPLPNRAKGYPAIMQDFKGLKIGVAARGTSSELLFKTMLSESGLNASDVTFVGVGGPATAYAALTIGKQVEGVIMFQPLTQLCRFNKTCDTVVDMTQGEGPAALKAMNGSSVIFAMRRDQVDSNPALMAAFYAAMRDAATWFNDPANFEELVKIYTPLISFGDLPGADQLRREWIKSVIPAYSPTLSVNRPAVKAMLDYALENKTIDKAIDPAKLVWDKAP